MVGNEDFDGLIFVGDGDDFVFAGDRLGHELDHVVWNPDGAQINIFKLVEFGERLGNLFAGGVAEFDEALSDGRILFFRNSFGFGQLLQGDNAAGKQKVGKIAHRLVHEKPSAKSN